MGGVSCLSAYGSVASARRRGREPPLAVGKRPFAQRGFVSPQVECVRFDRLLCIPLRRPIIERRGRTRMRLAWGASGSGLMPAQKGRQHGQSYRSEHHLLSRGGRDQGDPGRDHPPRVPEGLRLHGPRPREVRRRRQGDRPARRGGHRLEPLLRDQAQPHHQERPGRRRGLSGRRGRLHRDHRRRLRHGHREGHRHHHQQPRVRRRALARGRRPHQEPRGVHHRRAHHRRHRRRGHHQLRHHRRGEGPQVRVRRPQRRARASPSSTPR